VAMANVLVFITTPIVDFELQMRSAGGAWESLGMVGSNTVHVHFFYYLFVSLFFVNGLYVYLLHRARRKLATGSPA